MELMAVTKVVRLGAYEVRVKSKTFSEDFWLVMQDGDRVLMEIDTFDGEQFKGRWVPVEEFLEAVRRKDIVWVEV
jgi:uncharacterized protein with PIN domain